jgi:WD40 repeat protein
MILAAASSDGVRLFDATSRKLVGGPFGDNPAPNTQHGLTAMAFSPDGKTMAVGRWDGSIQIWDLASHAPIGPTMTGHAGEISGLAFSPDGKVLASGGATTYTGNNNYAHDNTVRLWDTTTHQQIGDPLIRVGADNTAPGPAFAPEGEKLAVAYSPGDGLVWNIGTQRPAGTLTGTDGLNSAITYSHAGALIADGDGHNVRLWDATTYRQLRDLKGHTNDVYAVAFSPDDSRLASASRDGTVRVWDPATGALVKQFTP